MILLALMFSLGIHNYSGITAQTPKYNEELIQTAKVYYDLGQFSAATTALEQALQGYQDEGNQLLEARTLSLLSLTYEQLGKLELVDRSIASSMSLIDKIPSNQTRDRVKAQILNRQGLRQLAKGEIAASIATLEKAEFFYTQSNDDRGIFISKINQAQALQALGFFRRATKVLDGLVEQLRLQPPSAIQLASLNSLGSLLRQQGKLKRAEQVLTKALTLANKLDLDSDTSKVSLNLGNTQLALASQARELKDIARVKNYQQQALENFETAANIATLPLSKTEALLNQFSLLVENQSQAQAKSLIVPISNNLQKLPQGRRTVFAQVNFAYSLLKLSPQTDIQKTTISEILETAIAQAENLQDNRAKSFALGALGRFYEVTNQIKIAKEYSTSALIVANQINAPDLTYKWEWQLGRLLTTENKDREAIDSYTQAVNDLKMLRQDLVATDSDIQFSFRQEIEPVYRQLVQLLLRTNGKAQPSQANLKLARNIIESLQLAQLENFFRSACFDAKTEQIDNLSESELSTAVFYPIILPLSFEVIVKLPQRQNLRHYKTPRFETELRDTLSQLQQYLKEPDRTNDVKQLSQQVYNWLIEPIISELEQNEIKSLVFVLDGELRNIPMGVLYDAQKQQYLIEKYAIAVAPGLQLLDPKPLSSDRLDALIGGLEADRMVEGKEFSRLDNVGLEIEQIQSQVNRGELLLDSSFTRNNLRDRIKTKDFSIVHLATHGQFSSQLEETFILTWDRLLKIADLDELLQLNNLRRNSIELLVLSACETALGDKQAALGLAGIAVQAGAKSTLATLWSVDDLSTARVMGEFYRQLSENQISKAEALRRAQLQLWQEESQDWQRPYFWASFTLVGNWL